MRRLKRRTRADSHVSQARAPVRRSWDRAVYLVLLAAFFGALANYVAGDRVLLRADGLVLRERAEIGAPGLVRIVEVAVGPGQVVRRGELLLRAESLETLTDLAELAIREAELTERAARLRAEIAAASELAPRAEARRGALAAEKDRLSGLARSGLVTAARAGALSRDLHDAEMDAATLRARMGGLAREARALEAQRGHARDAIARLRARYADGEHRAAADGVVGDAVPVPGEVMNPGETILTLYSGGPYVLAYLPARYVFGLDVGDAVAIRSGRVRRTGRIEAILPMSTGIPDEFRTAFRHRETRQLARIAMEDGPALPTHAAVRITSDWRGALAAAAARWRDAPHPSERAAR